MMLAVPLLLISFFISALSVQVTREKIGYTYTSTLQLTAGQFSDRLKDLEMLTSSLSVDDNLNAMCIQETGNEDLYAYVQFQSRLRAYVNQRILKSNVTLYLPKQGWLLSSRGGISRASANPAFGAYRSQFAQWGDWGIRPSVSNPSVRCLSVVRGYIHERQSNGIFIIEIDGRDALSGLSNMDEAKEVSNLFLMDAEGNGFARDEASLSDGALQSAVMKALDGASAAELPWRAGGHAYRALAVRLADSHCAVGILIDEQAIIQPIQTTQRWGVAIIVAFLLASVLYMIISYRQVTEPVDHIQAAMKQVEAGDFSARADAGQKNELGEVAAAFNHMVEQLDGLIQERYLHQIQLTQAQLRFLRVQINPHFLYNCLFTLYTLIKSEELEAAADLAIYLGQYFQITSRAESGEVPLYQEIEHVRLLVKIQNMRFSDRLRLDEHVDDALKMALIPNLALLTIVENFMTHGMKTVRGMAVITIGANSEGERVTLSVSDNGSGVPEEQLQAMQAAIDAAALDESNAHGLQNVAARFRMMYGEGTKLKVEASEPHGLTVRVEFRPSGDEGRMRSDV